MKFYLAGRYSRREEINRYAIELVVMGHSTTSVWTNEWHPLIQGKDISPQDAVKEYGWRFGQEDIAGIEEADAFVAFTDHKRPGEPVLLGPDQYDELGRGGRHTELGIAIGLGKPIVIIGPIENVFQQYLACDVYRDGQRDYRAWKVFPRWFEASKWFEGIFGPPARQLKPNAIGEEDYGSQDSDDGEPTKTDEYQSFLAKLTVAELTANGSASSTMVTNASESSYQTSPMWAPADLPSDSESLSSSWGDEDEGEDREEELLHEAVDTAYIGRTFPIEGVGGHPRFKELLDEAWDLHRRKALQYGSPEDPLDNLHAHTKMGYASYDACMIEIHNIGARIGNLVRRLKAGEKGGAALKDALMDLSAFSYLGIITLEEDGAICQGDSDE